MLANLCTKQTATKLERKKQPKELSNFVMAGAASSSSTLHLKLTLIFVLCILLSPALALLDSSSNETFHPGLEFRKWRWVKSYLKKVNKPAVKSIVSPDGDVIDCVSTQLQPAFDHPLLKGHKPLEAPERPRGGSSDDGLLESLQHWAESGETCPEGTVPIRRITEQDVLRSSSVQRFGRKRPARNLRRDSTSSSHEHAVVFVNQDQYYGAKASLNVWTPGVTDESEFSLSQIWVISGSFGNDLNTIEAGWQVSPELYGDNSPRFFTYWTSDAYQTTGCYNLLCSGFVQINNKIAIGAAISPRSSLFGTQYDIGLMIWKDLKRGHWWLQFGHGLLIGYWPSFLFNKLRDHASMIQFGGEVVNTRPSGYHTSTQMGSGQFAKAGFGKAAYFRNLQVVDGDNSLVPLKNMHQLADHPNCYDIRQGRNNAWGTFFYYGGPGKNVKCP